MVDICSRCIGQRQSHRATSEISRFACGMSYDEGGEDTLWFAVTTSRSRKDIEISFDANRKLKESEYTFRGDYHWGHYDHGSNSLSTWPLCHMIAFSLEPCTRVEQPVSSETAFRSEPLHLSLFEGFNSAWVTKICAVDTGWTREWGERRFRSIECCTNSWEYP
jgi:hypothetical protein